MVPSGTLQSGNLDSQFNHVRFGGVALFWEPPALPCVVMEGWQHKKLKEEVGWNLPIKHIEENQLNTSRAPFNKSVLHWRSSFVTTAGNFTQITGDPFVGDYFKSQINPLFFLLCALYCVRKRVSHVDVNTARCLVSVIAHSSCSINEKLQSYSGKWHRNVSLTPLASFLLLHTLKYWWASLYALFVSDICLRLVYAVVFFLPNNQECLLFTKLPQCRPCFMEKKKGWVTILHCEQFVTIFISP